MKILAFYEPTLQITYQDLYTELAGHLDTNLNEASHRFPPDEAVTALRYFRRQEQRRQTAHALANRLGVDTQTVFAACTQDGPTLLLDQLQPRA